MKSDLLMWIGLIVASAGLCLTCIQMLIEGKRRRKSLLAFDVPTKGLMAHLRYLGIAVLLVGVALMAVASWPSN